MKTLSTLLISTLLALTLAACDSMAPELQRSETRSDAVASIAPSPLHLAASSTLAGVCTETPITTNTAFQYNPAIHGDMIVWQDYRNGNTDIYAYDLSTGTETPITTNTASQTDPVNYGDVIVWTDERNGNFDLAIYAQVCTTDPAAALDVLITDVEALSPNGTGTLNQGQSGALTRKLDQALRLIEQGKNSEAVAVLADFREQVQDLEAEGVLSAEEASALVATAEAIIGLIGTA